MSNFTFLQTEWPNLYSAFRHAERNVHDDPRTALFYSRRAVEVVVNWLYEYDTAFTMPHDDNLNTMLREQSFVAQVPHGVQDKMHLIRKRGNDAVHSTRAFATDEAMRVLRELFHIGYWFARTYTRENNSSKAGGNKGRGNKGRGNKAGGGKGRGDKGNRGALPERFDPKLVPPSDRQVAVYKINQLNKLTTKFKEADDQLRRQREENEQLQLQLAQLQAQVTQQKSINQQIPDTHDYSEAETRRLLIDIFLREVGWDPNGKDVVEYEVRPMPNPQGVGYADYVLWGDDGLPLAVIEAKRTNEDKEQGKQQAKLYADALEQMTGQRPVIYYTNGYEIGMWDDLAYPPREVQGFYTKDELQRLIQRRVVLQGPAGGSGAGGSGAGEKGISASLPQINKTIVNRYYHELAIQAIAERLDGAHRGALVAMAAGTGKTRTAIALVDLLMRANLVNQVLYLTDRENLARQTLNAWATHLPDLNLVNLTDDGGFNDELDGELDDDPSDGPVGQGRKDLEEGATGKPGESRRGKPTDLSVGNPAVGSAATQPAQGPSAGAEAHGNSFLNATSSPNANSVLVATYQAMLAHLNDLDDLDDDAALTKRFGVGRFDLIVVDEAYRSVHPKFRGIFDYFDGYLIGFTAAPKDDIDEQIYALFEIEERTPTLTYSLDEAITDHYLVPPNPMTVPLKFMREGIRYSELSAEDQAEWDLIEWGHVDRMPEMPEMVESGAINNWLFNEDTVDKVLATLMERGIKVAGGDRLGKTIIFAKNHDHAEFIQSRFDANYPHLAGSFARVIDDQASYVQSLIDDFGQRERAPHIAISVDMLDTGVDVPEVVNLVFFKLVRSKAKFFQMLGRGTRLCPDLFGPGLDKESFDIFDVCQNFEFFNYNPHGIALNVEEPLRQRLFNARLKLAFALIQNSAEAPAESPVEKAEPAEQVVLTGILDLLHAYVAAMPLENFLVRPQRKLLEPFLDRSRWDQLRQADVANLTQFISGLPSQLPTQPVTAKRIDLLMLELQLAHYQQRTQVVQTYRTRLVEIARGLASERSIPAVRSQMALINNLQSDGYWQKITVAELEEARLNLRRLAQYIQPQGQRIIITDFVDELGTISQASLSYVTGGVNVARYRKQIEQFLHGQANNLLIQKIRHARMLTATDLQVLEQFFYQSPATGTQAEFEQAYGTHQNLAAFIRRVVGLDRGAARERFLPYLNTQRYTADQIQFVEQIINHLARRGVMDSNLFYESPFIDISPNGLTGLFTTDDANAIMQILQQINESVLVK